MVREGIFNVRNVVLYREMSRPTGTPSRNAPSAPTVECEFDRDGAEVVISVRSTEGNFVMILPLDGASTFAAAAAHAIDENCRTGRSRFILHARLQVSK